MQGKGEHGTAFGIGFDGQTPVMIFDDGAADGQSHAHTFRLGSEKGLEQAFAVFPVDAMPPVDDGDLHRPFAAGARPNGEHALVRLGILHGVEPIADEVEHHLLDQDAVGVHVRQTGRDIEREANTAPLRIEIDETERIVEDRRHRHGGAARLALLHEFADAADDLARTLGLRGGPFHHRQQFRHRRARFHTHHAAVAIIGNGRQGLVDFVRQHRSHLAHRDEARGA